MSLHTLKRTIQLPISLEKAWDFFSSPLNLKVITPPHMGFDITSEGADQKIYPGMIISYNVRPILNVPLEWVTEITQVKDKSHFIDEQRIGPYKMWHHQHFFKEVEDGVECTDLVHYVVPLGILGDIANVLFVRKQLEEIFNYRTEVLEKLFVSK
jgi:ligand-binding SRPBCC domain-containing protein